MKLLIIFLGILILCTTAEAQKTPADSTKKQSIDTIRIGGIIIIKTGEKNKNVNVTIDTKEKNKKKNANISTNWWIMDIGFSNYTDNTNYANTGSYLINKPGSPALNAGDFKLRYGKSINVNLWFFMQRINLADHHLNFKYGVGLELNNYKYNSPATANISYKEGGTIPYTTSSTTNAPFIFRDSISFSKNKLAADYLTVPLMLNFVSNPERRNEGISVSFGVSAGYLYSQRNKQKSAERGTNRNKGDYDLNRFKFSYVAELGLGRLHFYGSYSPQSFYQHSLDMKPYTVGLRFSNW